VGYRRSLPCTSKAPDSLAMLLDGGNDGKHFPLQSSTLLSATCHSVLSIGRSLSLSCSGACGARTKSENARICLRESRRSGFAFQAVEHTWSSLSSSRTTPVQRRRCVNVQDTFLRHRKNLQHVRIPLCFVNFSWLPSVVTCTCGFKWSGCFTTTTVPPMLFGGEQARLRGHLSFNGFC